MRSVLAPAPVRRSVVRSRALTVVLVGSAVLVPLLPTTG